MRPEKNATGGVWHVCPAAEKLDFFPCALVYPAHDKLEKSCEYGWCVDAKHAGETIRVMSCPRFSDQALAVRHLNAEGDA